MSDWLDLDQDFLSEPFANVEELLRLAADDLPVVRSGLRAEIVTRAQRTQREIRFEHLLWGAVATLFLLGGALIWWPANSASALASRENDSRKPVNATIIPTSGSVDWDLVESKSQLRRRNLEILRNAF